MLKGRIAALVMTMLIVGCSTRPAIPVSDEQTLVMESSVLAAGITAQQPSLSISEINSSASSTLFNERQEPVTVHYRFSGMTYEVLKCIRWKRRAASLFRQDRR